MSDKLQKHDAAVVGGDAGKFVDEPDGIVEISNRCPAMLDVGAGMQCTLRAGHEGGHLPRFEQCAAILTVSPGWDVRCDRAIRHEGMHESARDGEVQPFRWANGNQLTEQSTARTLDEFLAERLKKNAPILQQQPLQKAKPWNFKLGPRVIEPGASLTIGEMPQCYFRVEQIRNLGDKRPDVIIRGAFVGRKAQPLDREDGPGFRGPPAPVSRFNDGLPVKWDTCQPALTIAIQFQNVSSERRTVEILLEGRAVVD